MTAMIIFTVVAYLLGSVSSAVIVCKILKLQDPRETGSGNAGATNVLRTAGKKAAILVLIGDLLKGLLAIWIARLFGLEATPLAFVGIGAIIGHILPIFFGFKGGKGVATALGVILALSIKLAIVLIVVFAVVLLVFRYVSLASMSAAVLAPIFCIWFGKPYFVMPLAGMALIILVKHYQNISRLMDGIEPKVGEK